MSVMDDILQRFGLKYEDLAVPEREVLESWMSDLQKNQLTVDKIKKYIASMRDSVEIELTKVGHESKQDLFLKARLRNYLLIEAFLATPERARQAIERSLMNIPTKK